MLKEVVSIWLDINQTASKYIFNRYKMLNVVKAKYLRYLLMVTALNVVNILGNIISILF